MSIKSGLVGRTERGPAGSPVQTLRCALKRVSGSWRAAATPGGAER